MQNEEQNPWQTLSVSTRYENPWISVSEHQVINPAGNPGIYGVVHFKNLAIGIIPLDSELNTWLIGQYRYPLDTYSWEIPEGGSPEGISAEEGARRELKEETGMEAGHLEEVLRMHLSNSVSDELAILFVATNLQYGEAMPEETEQLQLRKLPFSEAYQMVLRGEITDAMSVAGILRVQMMLDSKALIVK
jgi:8-oxo-dGTP pyrophosphatase MutT (NUDIX family)